MIVLSGEDIDLLQKRGYEVGDKDSIGQAVSALLSDLVLEAIDVTPVNRRMQRTLPWSRQRRAIEVLPRTVPLLIRVSKSDRGHYPA